MIIAGHHRDLVVRTGSLAVRARLNETPAAHVVAAELPVYGTVSGAGHRLEFAVPLSPLAEATMSGRVARGALCVCPARGTVIIVTAPGVSIPEPWIVFARAIDDVGCLAAVAPGALVALLEPDS